MILELPRGRVKGSGDQRRVPPLVLARTRKRRRRQVLSNALACVMQSRAPRGRVVGLGKVHLEAGEQGLLKLCGKNGL
ncbi:hypothetical protein [Muricoccus nepalensis]|uniref:hypothetical protein n=1 Tax=Muricoccus nepalensis TaxID=1854500 RepID=UPI001128788D|nr:hypothetical protein [Roseomonas nepalensis]